jgi:ubiquitin-protein ligase/DNA-directed RNA polymerase subunit RPC12/RpoP
MVIMISFSCDKCGKTFKVPDEYAGRTAKCKICGNGVKVPALHAESVASPEPVLSAVAASMPAPPPIERAPEPVVTPPPPAPGKIPMRTRRLRADAEVMRTAFANFDAIRVTPLAGNPPEAYRVHYHIASLQPGPDGQPIPQPSHEIEIQLTSDYPRLSPRCKILTPIFHPNFDATTICVGDHWTAGERLVDLVIRIGEMIAFQAYNIQSPLDGQAAMWADLNREKLPTDSRNLRPADLE